MPKVLLSREDITEFEDVQAEVAVIDNTTANTILQITTKNARRAFLVFVGMSWDAALDTFTTWRVKRDNITINELKDSKVQIAAPEQPFQEITPWIELPQQTTIKFEADVSGAGANGNVVARFRVYYANIQ